MSITKFISNSIRGCIAMIVAAVLSVVTSTASARMATSATSSKERLIFVVNTTENDVLGGASAPYLDEYRWIQRWTKNYPDARIIRIRASTNRGVQMQLQNWMLPNPETKEVVALDIHSHGAEMTMLNESADFAVQLPDDISSVFSPVIGRFAPDARIIIGGCETLSNKNPAEAMASLKSIADAFQMHSGHIYANETVGAEGLKAFEVNVWNKDIPWEQRKRTLKVYLAWFLTLPNFAYKDRFESNQGYLLETRDGETTRFGRWRYSQNFD